MFNQRQQLKRQALLEERAHEMRHQATFSEAALWSALKGKQLGVTFKRQVLARRVNRSVRTRALDRAIPPEKQRHRPGPLINHSYGLPSSPPSYAPTTNHVIRGPMRAPIAVALFAAFTWFFDACTPSEVMRPAYTPKPLNSAPPATPTAAMDLTIEPAEGEGEGEGEGAEPAPIWVKGAYVIAHAKAAPDSATHAFEIWPFENHTWVSFCAMPHPQGCVQPQLLELREASWVNIDSKIRGLPPLQALDLHALPNSPFRDVSPETEQGPNCHSGPAAWRHGLLNGSRSIAATYGTFPDNAWAVVRLALDHSGGPIDDLYRWQGQRWQLALPGTQLDDAIVAANPFSGGLAVVRSRRGPKLEQPNYDHYYDLLFVSSRNQQVLLSPQAETIQIAQRDGSLVAVSTPNGPGPKGPHTEVHVALWRQPDRPPLYRVVQVNLAENATLLDLRIEEKLRVQWYQSETEAKELTVELVEPFADSVQVIPWVQPGETGPTLIESSPANTEPLLVTSEWKLQGRSFWLAMSDSNRSWTLFSDQPVKEVWNPKPIQVRLPRKPRCGGASHSKSAGAPAKF